MRSWNPALSVALGSTLLLLLTACGESQVMIVIQDGLELREAASEDSAVLEKLALGTRVTVHAPRVWDEEGWHRVEAKAGMGWTKPDGLAPYPLRGETRFVRVEELPVYATREASGSAIEVLKLEDEVQLLAVDPPGAPEYRGVIRGGNLRGFVDEFGLDTERPTTRRLLEGAQETLKAGELERAERLARSALAMAEGKGRSGALVRALEQVETEPSSLQEALTGFDEKAFLETAPGSGAPGYVVPYRVSLREGPDLRDAIVTVLPADAAVEVLSINGPWAHVALLAKQTPWMSVDLGDLAKVRAGETAALSASQRGARTRGYVQLSSLQAKRPSPSEHLAKAQALSPEEDTERRIELLMRAVVIARPDEVPPVARALIDEAFAAERYRLAVAAAVKVKEPGRSQDSARTEWRIETVSSLYGCSGRPLEAQIVQVDFQPGMKVSKPSGSACALVTGLTAPCDVCLSDLSEYDAQDRQHVLRDKLGVDNALRSHEDVITDHLTTTSRLEDVFPRPSRMKVTVRAAAGAPPGRLFLFELPLEVDRYQPKLSIHPSFREARVSEVALPDEAVAGRWEYWLSTLQWEDVAHGALFAPDPKAAWKAVQGFAQALKSRPQELLTRNEEHGVVYSLHVSPHCGKCPARRQ